MDQKTFRAAPDADLYAGDRAAQRAFEEVLHKYLPSARDAQQTSADMVRAIGQVYAAGDVHIHMHLHASDPT